ncbi:uncharacterized protein LOC115216191 [Argonauta hians]
MSQIHGLVYHSKLNSGTMQQVTRTTFRINMNIGLILLFYLLGVLRCDAYNPDEPAKGQAIHIEETVTNTTGILNSILTSLVSNKANTKLDRDHHYSSKAEEDINNFFRGKLKATRNNWFEILPTPVVTKDISLRTVVGCLIAALGERFISEIEPESHRHGQHDAGLRWAKDRLTDLTQFLQRAICTFELVDENKNSFINHSEYTTFVTVIQDYIVSGKYLYKLAVSAYRQLAVEDFDKSGINVSISCSKNVDLNNCSSETNGILKQLRCLSNCQQTNHCRNKITKLRKMLRRSKRMIINTILRLKFSKSS